MRLYIVQAPSGMECKAFSSLALANAEIAANNGNLKKNLGPQAPASKDFTLKDSELGDKVWISLFFSDNSGNCYIGGVFDCEDEANACNQATKQWKIGPDKYGSGELYVLDAVIQ